jgi:hypothetical protein
MDSERKPPERFAEELKRLVAANLEGNARLLNRFGDLVRNATRDAATGRPRELPSAPTLVSQWLDFNLASYSVLTTHGLALMNGLLSAAESALVPKAPAPEASPTPRRVELRLEGRPGERVASGFAVENHFDRPLEVGFESADLVPAAGAALPASLVGFEPSTLAIGPKCQAVVHTAVTLTPEFVVGQTYTTTIRLIGFPAREVGLSISVLPPADAPKPAEPSRRKGAPGKKRRRGSSR